MRSRRADLSEGGQAGATTAQDLILATVDNYDFYDVEPFLVTLRETGFSGHLCLFAGPNIGKRTICKLNSFGAEVVGFGAAFPFVQAPHPDSPKSLPEPIYIYNYRHFLYYDYLLKYGARFRNVLITDVKDVVFQKNPFDFAIADAIHVAMENTDIPLGDSFWTRSWIVAGFGQEVLERLKECEVSCAGTTVAPVPLMQRYLELMLAQVQSMKDAYECADQAAHNLLLHDGLLEPVRRLYNFEGPILTVGTEPGYRLDSDRRLVNRDGSVIAVVHQYDRHRELARLFDKKVRPGFLLREAKRIFFRWKKPVARRTARLRQLVGNAWRRAITR